jgi:hypothetical protein
MAGLAGELVSALGDNTSDLYAPMIVNNRWLSGKTLASNGVVLFAQREALSRGLLHSRTQCQHRLPKSLQWSESLPAK